MQSRKRVQKMEKALKEKLGEGSSNVEKLNEIVDIVKGYLKPDDWEKFDEITERTPKDVGQILNEMAAFINHHVSPDTRKEMASILRERSRKKRHGLSDNHALGA